MAKAAKIAWGIDVGNHTLKAIKLAKIGNEVEVLDFAMIQHEKILSQPDVNAQERSELISKALTQFLSEHEIGKAVVVVSVPGQQSLARFIKLPPVEEKRIPEIVRFEAIQQIPFDINDVEWDWQAFPSPNMPEVEVGIFAIKRELVRAALEPFAQANCPVDLVQMAPMALYNFLYHDQQNLRSATSKEAIVLLDIGAENTDLVIADGIRIWQRSISKGGNQFTAAVQKSFKLSFTKAEDIKCHANTSKYARQIFQAMRSVFADLAAEIQRSLGFYSSGNREVQFRKVLALGNAVKLPGLAKFLQQSLSLPVKRLDSFESVKMSAQVSVAQFAENLPAFPTAYGLAIQGLGLGIIESNLLPREIARQAQWKRKRRLFVAAAAIFTLSAVVYLFQALSQKSDLNSSETLNYQKKIDTTADQITQKLNKKDQLLNTIKEDEAQNVRYAKFYQSDERKLIPQLLQAIRQCLPNEDNLSDPRQVQLHQAYRTGNRPAILSIPRNERQQVFISSIQLVYTEDLDVSFDAVTEKRVKAEQRAASTYSTITSRRPETSPGSVGPGMGPGGFGPAMREGEFRGPMGGPGGFGPAMREGEFRGPMQGPGGFGPARVPGRSISPGTVGRVTEQTSRETLKGAVSGFVVVIEGTTPHKENRDFLWTPQVGVQRDKWGFFNRLRYLGKTDEQIRAEEQGQSPPQPDNQIGLPGRPAFGGSPSALREPNRPGPDSLAPLDKPADSPDKPDETSPDQQRQLSIASLPLETYVNPKAEDEAYFDYSQRGWLSGQSADSADQPDLAELGLLKKEKKEQETSRSSYSTSEQNVPELPVYLDPLTYEPISVTYVYDENGQMEYDSANKNPKIDNHDYWFRVKFKVKIKEKPQEQISTDA